MNQLRRYRYGHPIHAASYAALQCRALSPLALERVRTTIKSISQSLRHISVRVVNFASSSLEDEDHVRLGNDNADEHVVEDHNGGVEKVVRPYRILWADQLRPARDVRFFDILVRGLFST